MAKVKGSAPLFRLAATTRASARAVAIGSKRPPSSSAMIAACSAGETVMALPLMPRLKGATIGTLTWPTPRLEAMATGANRCAASKRPMFSLSRTFDHDTSRTRVTSRPSAAVNPLSTATMRAAASTSGMKPMWREAGISGAQQDVGLLLGQPLQFHQDSLGAIDHLALLERHLGAVELVLQLGESVEAGDAEVQDRLHPLLLQPIHDIGGDAGIDGGLDRGGIALVDEHGDRAAHRPADLEHLLQDVAAGVFQINDNDIGVERIDPGEQALHLADAHDAAIARLAQPLLQDGGTDRALVDNHDFGRLLGFGRRLLGGHLSLVFRTIMHSMPNCSLKPCLCAHLGLAHDQQSGRF